MTRKNLDRTYSLVSAALMLSGNDEDRDMVVGADAIVRLDTAHSDKAKTALIEHAIKRMDEGAFDLSGAPDAG